MTPEQIARVVHEVNRAYCEALGDTSQPKWEDAPQWQRDSAMLGVTAGDFLRSKAAMPNAKLTGGASAKLEKSNEN